MGMLEVLTINFGPSLMKVVSKLWLKDVPFIEEATDCVNDVLKGKIEKFATRRSTEQLFDNLQDEIAKRLSDTIAVEFGDIPEGDKIAAILSVKEIFDSLDLSEEMARTDLDASRLQQSARLKSDNYFNLLGEKGKGIADLVLDESCAYIVSLAGKLPDFQIAATRELLKRTSVLQAELSAVLDGVMKMRDGQKNDVSKVQASFETSYRRTVVFKLDRLHLFGLRLIGAGARDYELSIAYVTLTSSTGDGLRSGNIDEYLPNMRRVLIRGEAGSGKTTLMQWLAVRAAKRDFVGALEHWNEYMPIYLKLRDYADGVFPNPEKFIESIAPSSHGLMPAGWVHHILRKSALLIIDGVDEIPAAKREDFFDWINELSHSFEDAVIVVSSRPAALDAEKNSSTLAKRLGRLKFESLTLEPMSLHDSENLISHWHTAVGRDLQGEEVQKKLEQYDLSLRKSIRERPAIASLASNPLMCAMICALNWDRQQELPSKRMELYKLALEMLLHTREAERKISAVNLAKIGPKAKEELLEGLAYWMLRNGYSEAAQNEVVIQIEILIKRLPAVDENPSEILQELLERSGVLRQPQHGVIDFIHRTFLEYMAASAAVKQGDIGVLVERAQEESWRETIVFAAGHAEGVVRDKLIGELLKKPLLRFNKKVREADVTTVCCLETASASLDPELLGRLKEKSKALFPPKDFASARLLGPAAALEPTLLMGHNEKGEQAIASCIRCAGMVAGNEMLSVIGSYAHINSSAVAEELLQAWPMFEFNTYVECVIKKMPFFIRLGFDLDENDLEIFYCLQFLIIRDSGRINILQISEKLELFFREGILLVGGQGRYEGGGLTRVAEDMIVMIADGKNRLRIYKKFTMADAERIAALKSIKRLVIDSFAEPEVLSVLAGLPNLKDITVNNSMNLSHIVEMKNLTDLKINVMTGFYEDLMFDSDLVFLNKCPGIKRLTIEGVGKKSSSINFSRSIIYIEELNLLNFPLNFGDRFPLLSKLSVLSNFTYDEDLRYDGLQSLEYLALDLKGDSDKNLTIVLPESLIEFKVNKFSRFTIRNIHDIKKMRVVELYSVNSEDKPSILKLFQSGVDVLLKSGNGL
ncbi:NACHT domain-containing protein [Delftia sp. HK171]|uniref:NACHT domain-containing protein n=1 Tax=Delftia sp. HK171 TaxID=1920191 RepID=UPI000A47E246|nr:NACHT domain-containing protein [Delftia sp. HK171]